MLVWSFLCMCRAWIGHTICLSNHMDILFACALPFFFTCCACMYIAYWVYDLFTKKWCRNSSK
jgi:hypothetical protein